MSDTEKQFQAALRDVEYKLKREIESEVMSDKPESRDLLYCICSDPENCRGPVPRALCRRIYGVPGKGKEPTTNAELVEKIQARIQEFGGQVHPGTYQPELLALFREIIEALTAKQDGVTISSWAATEATEALKVVQGEKYHMCSEYEEALSEILAALKQGGGGE